jgi:predicted Fe-Mo cluster-binding NifX family protein
MRVAIPTFGDEVAPRFCFARELLVVEVDGGSVGERRRYVLSGTWSERIKTLSELGVGVLLCCGFNRNLLPMAGDVGLTVIWGLQGDVNAILDDYVGGSDRPT